MKTCPKCNEILGDSVKVCVKCRYQFEQDELQEALDKGESVKKFSQDRMDAQKWNNRIVILVILFICLITAAFLYLFGTEISFVENGGIRCDSSRFIPYEFTVYWNHAVVNKYLGEEQEVDIPASLWGRPVTVIGDRCFRPGWGKDSNIVKAKIPKTVVEIEEHAFWYCEELVEVTGGKNVKVVGEGAFADCPALTVVELGTKIERIEWGGFRDCNQLKQFARQDKLEYIGPVAFWNSGLEEFEFDSDIDVEFEAFANTPWLEKQTEEFLIYGDGSLLYYNGQGGRIIIPDGVKTLLYGSFVGLTDSEIFLPPTVQKIENYCFNECTNIKIYIPSSVKEMGVYIGKTQEEEILFRCSEVTIVTTKGSHAEEYAKEHNIPYEIVESW